MARVIESSVVGGPGMEYGGYKGGTWEGRSINPVLHSHRILRLERTDIKMAIGGQMTETK